MKIEQIKDLRQALENENISYAELAEIDIAATRAGITVTDEMLASDILDKLEENVPA